MNSDEGQMEATDKESRDQELEAAISHGASKNGFQIFTGLCGDKGPLRGSRPGFAAND